MLVIKSNADATTFHANKKSYNGTRVKDGEKTFFAWHHLANLIKELDN